MSKVLYTAHGTVNDGRSGFPNIVAELSWSEGDGSTYLDALRYHCVNKNCEMINYEKSAQGRISTGHYYRDYIVTIRSNTTGSVKDVMLRIFRKNI